MPTWTSKPVNLVKTLALVALAAVAALPVAAGALPKTGPPVPVAPSLSPVPKPAPTATATKSPTPAGETTVTVPVFPITASQSDSLANGTGGQMKTDVSITANGGLAATTTTHEMTMLHGFDGGVSVVLTDDGKILWASPVHYFSIDGTLLGRSDRTDTWNENVPAALLPAVRGVAIVHIAKAWSIPGAATVGTVMGGATRLLGSAVGHATAELAAFTGQIVGLSVRDTAVGTANLVKIVTTTIRKI